MKTIGEGIAAGLTVAAFAVVATFHPQHQANTAEFLFWGVLAGGALACLVRILR